MGLDDRAQLRYATRQGRVIVTADLVDFVTLAEEAVAANVSHAGIVLVPGGFRLNEFGALAEALAEVVRRYPTGAADVVLVLRRRKS